MNSRWDDGAAKGLSDLDVLVFLALMMLNLLRRQLAQAGIPLSVVKMMNLLTDIREVTLLYPSPPGSKKPFARTVLSDMDPTQRKIVDVLGLERYRHS